MKIKSISIMASKPNKEIKEINREMLVNKYKTDPNNIITFFKLHNMELLNKINKNLEICSNEINLQIVTEKKNLKKNKNIVQIRKEKMELELLISEKEKKIKEIEEENEKLTKKKRLLNRKIEKDTKYIKKQIKEIERLNKIITNKKIEEQKS